MEWAGRLEISSELSELLEKGGIDEEVVSDCLGKPEDQLLGAPEDCLGTPEDCPGAPESCRPIVTPGMGWGETPLDTLLVAWGPDARFD
mmetsp:Transcript_8377/g.20700  ORF Transcript_8377/g.20700 Transcript_8377/m.20700 type:complete len:89 (-) Transcript_8377:108-374(-)